MPHNTMDSYPSLLFCGENHEPQLVPKNEILQSVITTSPLPYGLPEISTHTNEMMNHISNTYNHQLCDYVNDDSLQLSLSYDCLPQNNDIELKTTLLPVSQYLIEPDSLPYLEKDQTFVGEDIQDIPIHHDLLKNTTPYSRKITSTSVKGNIGNQPILPGGLTMYRSFGLLQETSQEEEEIDSTPLVNDLSLQLLCDSIPVEKQKELINKYSSLDSIQSTFVNEVIPDLEENSSIPSSLPSPALPTFQMNDMETTSYSSSILQMDTSTEPDDHMETEESTNEIIKNQEFIQLVNEYSSLQVEKDSNFVQNIKNTRITTAPTELAWGIVDNSDMSHFHSLVPHLAQEFPFELDDFQKRSIVHLERGESVYVSAHTSAGKTVVADYAISLCQQHMTKCIYTSPVKALSNQKYHDFKEKYEDVGILTGDISVNPTASILVMTTEILRELLYNGSDIIRDVEWVVFDEAHYINDADRGVVWEESIILLPDHVNMVFLSATTPNVNDIADWIGRTKSKKVYIISTSYRPVPLEYDLIFNGKVTCIKDVNNTYYPERIRILHGNKPTESSKDNEPMIPAGVMKPSKKELESLASILKKNDDLPCIVFTLGRAQCDANAAMCSSIRLIDAKEAAYIKQFYMKCIQNLRKEDRELDQVKRLLQILMNGIGIHHSGLLPLLKEVVEMLFSAGYIKILFATETFAIGVNMPAKSVCFCGSGKFDGNGYRYFLSSEFTQMAGRAGRRGKDQLGRVYMLVNKLPCVSVIMRMVKPTTDAIKSRFKIDYSMIVNILRVQDLSLENMISHSFSEAVRLREIDQNKLTFKKQQLSYILKQIELDLSHLGCSNVFDYIKMEEEKKQQRSTYLTKAIESFTQPDSVLTKGRYLTALITFHNHYDDDCVEETVCCISSITGSSIQCYAYIPFDSSSIDDSNCLTVTPQYNSLDINKYLRFNNYLLYSTSITLADVTSILKTRSSFVTKQNVFRQNSNSAQFIFAVCQEIQQLYKQAIEMKNPACLLHSSFQVPAAIEENASLEYSRSMMHTVYPRIMTYIELKRKRDILAEEMSEEKLGLFPELHSRIAVLKNLNYVDANDVDTIKGRCCCFIRSGNELMLIEMLFDNLINDLSPPELAAVLSVMIFEREEKEVVIKNQRLKKIAEQMTKIATNLSSLEVQCGMNIDVESMVASRTRFGFMEVAYNWCKGLSFAEVMKCTNYDEGYVVNTLIRTEGVCRKLADIAYEIGNPDLRHKCEEVSQAMMRDIVFTPSLYIQE